ncbi:MAG: N-acetyl-gamma-glutamyl-phosphate reductase [Candidatus Anstonellales archaeon]
MKKRVSLIGVSGYVSEKLLELLSKHDKIELTYLFSTSKAGMKLYDVYPSLKNKLDSNVEIQELDFDLINSSDLVFVIVPHGESKKIVEKIKTKVIDLSKNYRLEKTYGIPEIFHEQIKDSKFVANPGCYATACILSVFPIKDYIEEVIFHGISGYSGAGRNAKVKFDYEDNIIAYKLFDHHHLQEIEKIIQRKITFLPHVVDVFSGILITSVIKLEEQKEISELKSTYFRFFNNYPLIKIVDYIPTTKEVLNKPFCKIHLAGYDKMGNLIVVSVIDNLMKGSASQAIQNMNLMVGLDSNYSLC